MNPVEFLKEKIKEEGTEIFWISQEIPNLKLVQNKFVGSIGIINISGRWTKNWRAVFEVSDDDVKRYVAVDYDVPATEMQEGSETDPEDWNVYEVKPVEKTIIQYEKV